MVLLPDSLGSHAQLRHASQWRGSESKRIQNILRRSHLLVDPGCFQTPLGLRVIASCAGPLVVLG